MKLNLDTRRNLLSVVLVSGIALLLLVGLVAFLVFGRADVASIEPASTPDSLVNRPVAKNPELAEISEYLSIVERPVFFADRQLPVIELAGDAGDTAPQPEPEPEPEVEIPELEATVAGIIITPDLKLAMVNDNASKETLVLREGMAMTGDKSAWKLAEIRARGVQFQTDDGRTKDLEMEVETDALKTGAPPRRQQTASDNQPQNGGPSGAASEDQEDAEAAARARAEEIRRRVAERRAQLRAEAERRAREQDNGG